MTSSFASPGLADARSSRSTVNGFIGTGALVRLALRRDRVLLPVWLGVFVAMSAGSASATVGLYPTLASRVQAAQTFNNAQSLVALYAGSTTRHRSALSRW